MTSRDKHFSRAFWGDVDYFGWCFHFLGHSRDRHIDLYSIRWEVVKYGRRDHCDWIFWEWYMLRWWNSCMDRGSSQSGWSGWGINSVGLLIRTRWWTLSTQGGHIYYFYWVVHSSVTRPPHGCLSHTLLVGCCMLSLFISSARYYE